MHYLMTSAKFCHGPKPPALSLKQVFSFYPLNWSEGFTSNPSQIISMLSNPSSWHAFTHEEPWKTTQFKDGLELVLGVRVINDHPLK